MSNVLINSIENASDQNYRIQSEVVPGFTDILASEVIAEFQKRCGNGMQYTTFPNTISDEEKSKLSDAGYIVTENTIKSENRDGAGDMYIGFQVAMNEKAAEKSMVISQAEENGSGSGGGGGGGGSAEMSDFVDAAHLVSMGYADGSAYVAEVI